MKKLTILFTSLFLLMSCTDNNKEESPIPVTGITINKTSTSIVVGGSEALTITIVPENATNKNVVWSSEDASVATVSDGKVTAVKAGTSTITATTTEGGKKVTCIVTVTLQPIPVTGLTIDKTKLSLKVGKTEVLVPTIAPNNATNQDITWESSNSSVATIKDGVVTAIAEGSATITATTVDGGKKATCTIAVIKDEPTTADVYAVGRMGSVAMLWKNNEGTALTDGTRRAEAKSVFVSGNDVYIAGWEDAEDSQREEVAKFWKNGVATALTDGTRRAYAESVFVSGNDVYIAGWEGGVAKLWKNGVATALTDGTKSASAKSVFVSGNDVYVAGYEDGVAKIWKNGRAIALSNGTNPTYTTSIYVSGNDVYVTGYERNGEYSQIAKLWKNGVVTDLTDGSSYYADAQSVFVSGNDVYVAGAEYMGNRVVARLWKNGVASTLLPDGTKFDYAQSVYVLGSDVYVALCINGDGGGENFAAICKNGSSVVLTEAGIKSSANSIFVK